MTFVTNKRKALTINDKLKIIQAVSDNNKKAPGLKRKLGDIAKEFEIKPCTLSLIIKKREQIESHAFSGCFSSVAKKIRPSDKFAEIDNALLEWFKTCRTRNIAITDELLRTKAQSFLSSLPSCSTFEGESTISLPWIQRWKRRHNITSKVICGESGSVSEDAYRYWLSTTVPSLLQRFSPSDIFNGDETGLFWKLTPQRTLAFVGDKCYGGKHSKERITVFVAASMTGEKLPLLVIGKSAYPRAFRNQRVPLEYTSNSKAWMTSSIFEEHIRRIDRQMKAANRKILLVIDNCPSHPKLDFLRHVTLMFLPPNSTSKTQPMDRGIIWSLKAHYRNQLMKELVIAHDANKHFQIDLMRALHWLRTAWNRVKVETIVTCFKSAGFCAESSYNLTTSNNFEDVGNIFEHLRSVFSLPDLVSAELYTSVDNDIITGEAPSEDCIIDNLLSQRDSIVDEISKYDNSYPDAQEQVPTHAETLEMLHKIQLYFLRHSSSQNHFCNLDSLRSFVTDMGLNNKKQTTIDNFVTRNV